MLRQGHSLPKFYLKDTAMDKRRAIQILTKAAALYHKNLENQKVLFLYGVPTEVKKQMQAGNGLLLSITSYEVVFHQKNFLHLTGVRISNSTVASATHFLGNVWTTA